MKANRVFAREVVADAVQADPGFLEGVDASWLERKWAYACGVTGEDPGDARPRVCSQDPTVIEVPGADASNDVVYLAAAGNGLMLLERTLDASLSGLSETEGVLAVRRRDGSSANHGTLPLALEAFLERVPQPAAPPRPQPDLVPPPPASKEGAMGLYIGMGALGLIPGFLLGIASYMLPFGSNLTFCAGIALGVLGGVAVGHWMAKSPG